MTHRIGTASHSIGRPPYAWGTGNPPKYMDLSRSCPAARSRAYSLGPTYVKSCPCQDFPGSSEGRETRSPTSAISVGFGLPAFVSVCRPSTSWNPPLFGTSALRYHSLSSPTHSPGPRNAASLARSSRVVDRTRPSLHERGVGPETRVSPCLWAIPRELPRSGSGRRVVPPSADSPP